MLKENKNSFKKGNVVLADLGDREGSVQLGVRPVVICSNDKNNLYSTVYTVVPLTTSKFKKKLPTHVYITTSNSDIEKDSIALCEQPISLDSRYILKDKPLFTLDKSLMTQINIGVMIQFGVINNNILKANTSNMAFAI